MKKIQKLGASALILALLALPTQAKEVHGIKFGPSISAGGKTLKLVGAGTRMKLIIPVYAMAAYSESGACDKNALIEKDEAKGVQIVMLRDVSAKDMAQAIGKALTDQMPANAPATLKNKAGQFEKLFKDPLKKGTKLDIQYLPGKGVSVNQSGKALGTIPGADFGQVFFKIYFAPNSCCPSLQKDILKCDK